jgi:hypothetical protein
MEVLIKSIDEIKENPNNPRSISKGKFRKLVNSIKEFPKMLDVRPLVINSEGYVLGGNMRLKAIKELGFQEVKVIVADEFTKEQEKEFLIKDNLPFGEWDIDMLANEYNLEDLVNWGFSASELALEKIEDIINETEYDEDPVYPISPKISEKHDYVMIVCDNSIDYNNLLTKLGLEYNQDYKCQRVGMGRVIMFDKFKKIFNEGNSESGDNEPQKTNKGRHKKGSK